MRRRSKKFTAALLAVLLTATTVFSDVSVVRAEEVVTSTVETVESNEMELSVVDASVDKSSDEEDADEQKATEQASTETTEETTSETDEEAVPVVLEEVETETVSETEETEEAKSEVISIRDFKVKHDTETEYTVKGIVTYVAGKNVYLQDETAGICAYFATADSSIKVGNVLTVKGKYKKFNDLEEIDKATKVELEATDEDSSVEAKKLSVAELIEEHDTYEGMLISLSDVLLGEYDSKTKFTTLTDNNGNTVNIYNCPELSENTTAGSVVNVTAVVSDYQGLQLIVRDKADVVEAVETITIAEARKADENTECTVKGIVTFIDGKNVYIQDKTAGIDLFYKNAQTDLAIGDTVYATGKRTSFNGLVELKEATTEKVGKGSDSTKLPSQTVTIKELLEDYSADSNYESTRVFLENVTLGATNKNNTPLTDADGNSINIYKVPELKDIKEGSKVNVYAVVGDYNGIQLRVASADDVTLAEGTEPEEPVEIYDPISDEDISKVEGAINVKDAAALSSGTATVVGQVVYKYVSNATDTSFKNILLEDVIDGTVYGYLVYDYNNSDKYEVGNVVAVTGTATVYSGVPEVKDVTNVTVLKTVDPIEAQEVTVSQLGADYLSEYVFIKDVTLGAYNAKGATPIKDATGESTIFKGVAYPDGITESSVVDLYAACTAYNTSYQLKNATSADYASKNTSGKVEIDDSITLPVASFAGTENLKDKMTVNGDLFAENDMLDTNATFTAYKAGQQVLPYIENKNTDKTTNITTYTYSLGSNKGMVQDDYFLIKTDASLYGNVEIAFRTRGSKTAAKNFVVEYSVDGENYKAAGDAHIVANYHNYATNEDVKVDKVLTNGEYYIVTDGKYQDVSVKLPEEANGVKELFIKIKVRDNARVDGKEAAISTGATTYINGIAINGNPLKSDSICQYVTVSPEAGETVAGQELNFKTDTKGATIYYAFDGASEFTQYDSNSKPVIEKLPCKVTAYAAKTDMTNSIRRTFTYTQSQVATVKATPNGGAVTLNSKVKLTCETEGAKILFAYKNEEANKEDAAEGETTETVAETQEENTASNTLEEGTYDWISYEEVITLTKLPCTILVKAVKGGFTDSEIKTLSFTERSNEKYNIYFGQMHSHTTYSDGAGSAQEAFEHAKATPNLDFLFITDHSNSYDNCDSANINDGSMSTEWVAGHALAEEYTTEDFVAAMGYEMTWSNGLGHINTFNSDGFQSRTQADYKTYATALSNYYNALQKAPDSISQFNHPGTTFGDFQDFAYYTAANDSLINLVEVGNGEGEIGSSGYFPSYEYYQRALDKGWHVAPTNNQDNHKGKWGSANTARSVVLADSLTEENIYDAMRNCRVYATEDNDLSIYYTLNDYIMGSVLDKDLVGDKVTIKVDLKDPTDSAIGTVQVIANGGVVVASQKVDANDTTVSFEVDNKYSFYYIKVVENDKDIAVTAPVWVGEVEAVGINSLSTSTVLPIKGEAIDVTLGLYNNEKTDLEIKSVEFSVAGETIKSVDLAAENLTKVPSQNTASYTFSYVYDKVGAMTIDVEVKAVLDGVEKVYNDKLSLTFVGDELVSHVVIDGSHYNDYVTGYYGGNMGNFIKMAAEKNVKAEIVTSTFTKDTLKNADMLIVSAPAKKAGTANAGNYTPSHFEQSFLDIVKEYVANGGTVIVCGIADYQDSTDGQTATETNKLLEAIGSTIRMNSDEAIDEVKNGGQEYRLYYENFDKTSNWMSGVVAGQTYSAYSGCTVDITNAKANDVVNEAVALVKGFDTTYSKNCKNDDGTAGDNSVDVEKGNVVALACQETKAGGAIFVGGTVFMSDFEVKAELDNNDSLPYINYTLMNNLLESKKVVMKATDIATVRKANLGDAFAIEGYVANGTDNEFTKFFDTIYVEDATGGITVFPFAKEGVKKGTKIRIVGYVDQYQGDKELQITSYEILDDKNLKTIKPTKRTTKEATNYDAFGGSFTQVTGKVTRVQVENGVVSEFWVKDSSGVEAAVFIDGYIYSGTTGKNELATFVKEGVNVTAAGFLYLHPEGASDVSVPVLRVPDCDGIVLAQNIVVNGSDDNQDSNTETEDSTDSVVTTPQIIPVQQAVTITENLVPLAGSIEAASKPATVEITLNADKKVLQLTLLTKYFENPMLPTSMVVNVYTGPSVGISLLPSKMKGVDTAAMEMNLTLEKKELPKYGNSAALFFEAGKTASFGFDFLIHMNLGTEYIGKTAKIYTRETADSAPVLVKEMVVNEIGNVGYQAQAVTDVIVLIEE